MKKNKLLFLIVLLLICFNKVNADEISYKDVSYETEDIKSYFETLCDDEDENSGDSVSIGEDGKCAGSGITSSYRDVPGTPVPDKPSDVPVKYDIVFLIDMSNSMKKKNKWKNVNEVLKTAHEIIKKSDGKHRYNICTFGNGKSKEGNKCYGWIDAKKNKKNNIKQFSKNSYDYDTYTMSGFDLVKNLSYKNVPLVLLITDGYPSYAKIDGTVYKMSNTSAPRYFYYTIEKMRDVIIKLKQKSPYARFYTFGALPSGKNDPVASFFLNPTVENYNNLSEGNTYGADLGTAVKEIYDGSNDVYDAVAARFGYPDVPGTIRGKVNGKKVIFNIPNGFKNFNYPKKYYRQLRFFLPTTSNSFSIKGCSSSDGKGKCKTVKCVKGYGNKRGVMEGSNRYCDIKLSSSYNSYVFKFNGGSFNRKIKKLNSKVDIASRYANAKNTNSSSRYFVDGSFFKENGAFSDEIKGVLNSAFEGKSKEEESGTSNRYYSGACARINNISYPSNGVTFYAKYTYTATKVTTNNSNKSSEESVSGTGCVSIKNLTFPALFYNNASFNFDANRFGGTIYAGGGYAFPDVSIKNDIHGVYGRFSFDGEPTENTVIKNPMFNSVSLIAETPDGKNKTKLKNVRLDTEHVYTDSSCNNAVKNLKDDAHNIDKLIDNQIKENIVDIDDELFTTIDSNDANSVSNISMYVKNEKKNGTKIDTTLTHSEAFINVKSGDIFYNSKKGDDYISGGNLQYIPLKYPYSTADITFGGNVSKFNKISVNVSGSCLVNVEQILYDCENGTCDASYKYRSIDHTNPFPKAGANNKGIPLNWQDWMSSSEKVARLTNTYNDNRKHYIFEGKEIPKKYKDTSYLSWSNIKANGYSSFVLNEFTTKKGEYYSLCPLGIAKVNGKSCLDR